PADAIPVILSIPARCRALLERAGPFDEIDARVRLRPTGEWSTVEYVAHVAEVLHVCANRLLCIVDDSRHDLTPARVDAPTASSNAAPLPVVCAQLVAAAARLAHVVNEAPPEAWTRTKRRGRVDVSALELL